MTTIIQAGDGRQLKGQFPLICLNSTSEVIPPYGVMQVVGASSFGLERVFSVTRPTGVEWASYVLNGPQAIQAGGYGAATNSYPADAAYSGPPVTGAECGPVAGSWLLSSNGKGFYILGGAAGGIVRVTTKSGTTAGDDFPLVKIVNGSGLSKPFGSIVGYGTPVDPPPGTLWRIPTFQSAAPTAGKPFCVLLVDIANGDTGDAGPVAVVPCQIDYTDAKHTHADCVTGDYVKLKSGTSGPATILWREKQGIAGAGSLGVQWARVLLGSSDKFRMIRGKAYTAVIDSTRTFDLYDLDPLASGTDPRTNPQDTTERIKVANVHKSTYATGDWVVAAYNLDAHLVVGDTANKADWEALPKGGGGVGTTRFAVVTTAAAKNGGLGNAVLIGDDLQPTASNPIEFRNVHQYAACRLSTRVTLVSQEQLSPGSLFADKKVFGTLVDVADYLVDLPGAAVKKSLVLPEAGSSAANVQWLGAEC